MVEAESQWRVLEKSRMGRDVSVEFVRSITKGFTELADGYEALWAKVVELNNEVEMLKLQGQGSSNANRQCDGSGETEIETATWEEKCRFCGSMFKNKCVPESEFLRIMDLTTCWSCSGKPGKRPNPSENEEAQGRGDDATRPRGEDC